MKKIRRHHRKITFREIAPNMVTSGNLLCGMLSVILVLNGATVPAAWLIFIAVFFDFMDGKVARSLGAGSKFGVEYDSLADVVSFGVAPSILFYSVYLQNFFGVAGALIASFVALCGALRLARFNIIHVPGSFQGLPIPGAGLFLASFVIGGIELLGFAAALLCVGMGILMISNIPYGNLKGMKKADRKKIVLFYVLAMVLVIGFQSRSILAAMSIYIVSGFLRIDWAKWFSEESEEDILEHNSQL